MTRDPLVGQCGGRKIRRRFRLSTPKRAETQTPTSYNSLVYTQRNAVPSIPPDLKTGSAGDLDCETPFHATCAEEASFSLLTAGLCGSAAWKASMLWAAGLAFRLKVQSIKAREFCFSPLRPGVFA